MLTAIAVSRSISIISEIKREEKHRLERAEIDRIRNENNLKLAKLLLADSN